MSPPLTSNEAADALRRGGVIAYPTEAVWGLGCDPFDESAVLRLLAIKQRPVEKGLILIAATLEQLKPLIDVAAVPTDRLADVLSSWPGPYTWVMPATAQAPRWITGQHRGIAVRVSQHPTVVGLCQAYGGALVSTSANLSGGISPLRMKLWPARRKVVAHASAHTTVRAKTARTHGTSAGDRIIARTPAGRPISTSGWLSDMQRCRSAASRDAVVSSRLLRITGNMRSET